MAVPSFGNSGTTATGVGAITPAYPATVNANQIAILVLETSNEPVAAASIGDGSWSDLDTSGNQLIAQRGVAAAANSIAMQMFWRRTDGSEDAATVNVPDAGDHALANIFTINGCVTTGNPIKHFTQANAAASTSFSIPGFTSTWTDILVAAAFGRGNDSASTAVFSGQANSDLTSFTERLEHGTTSGTGGGFSFVTGTKATSGSVGASTMTGPSATQASLQIALISTTSVLDAIAGTASITEADDTVSSAAALAIKAALAATEASDTLSSASKIAIAAALAATEASDTLSSASALAIAASAAITEAGDTLSATGTLAIAATADIMEADDTASSAATVTGEEAPTRRGRGALKAYVLRQKKLQIEEVAETIKVVPPPQAPQPIVAPLQKISDPSLGPLFADAVAVPMQELAPVRDRAEVEAERAHRERLIRDDDFLMMAA